MARSCGGRTQNAVVANSCGKKAEAGEEEDICWYFDSAAAQGCSHKSPGSGIGVRKYDRKPETDAEGHRC